jgi:hypothetical protein
MDNTSGMDISSPTSSNGIHASSSSSSIRQSGSITGSSNDGNDSRKDPYAPPPRTGGAFWHILNMYSRDGINDVAKDYQTSPLPSPSPPSLSPSTASANLSSPNALPIRRYGTASDAETDDSSTRSNNRWSPPLHARTNRLDPLPINHRRVSTSESSIPNSSSSSNLAATNALSLSPSSSSMPDMYGTNGTGTRRSPPLPSPSSTPSSSNAIPNGNGNGNGKGASQQQQQQQRLRGSSESDSHSRALHHHNYHHHHRNRHSQGVVGSNDMIRSTSPVDSSSASEYGSAPRRRGMGGLLSGTDSASDDDSNTSTRRPPRRPSSSSSSVTSRSAGPSSTTTTGSGLARPIPVRPISSSNTSLLDDNNNISTNNNNNNGTSLPSSSPLSSSFSPVTTTRSIDDRGGSSSTRTRDSPTRRRNPRVHSRERHRVGHHRSITGSEPTTSSYATDTRAPTSSTTRTARAGSDASIEDMSNNRRGDGRSPSMPASTLRLPPSAASMISNDRHRSASNSSDLGSPTLRIAANDNQSRGAPVSPSPPSSTITGRPSLSSSASRWSTLTASNSNGNLRNNNNCDNNDSVPPELLGRNDVFTPWEETRLVGSAPSGRH